MSDAPDGEPICGSVSPLTNVPCQKPPGHPAEEGHGADDVVMPDGHHQSLTWGAKRQ